MACRRKNLIWYGAIITPFVIAFIYLVITDRANDKSEEPITLDRILSDLDEKEPGWRLEDLEAQRQAIPDEENGALCVLAAHKLMGEKRPILPRGGPFDVYWDRPLDENIAEFLVEQINQFRPALTEAHRLEKLPSGRYPVSYPEYGLFGREARRQPVRDILDLLEIEGIVQIHTGHLNEAWQTCLAILNASRSLGDEPVADSQYLRMEIRQKAVDGIIEILKRGEIPVAELFTTLKLLENESGYPLIQVLLRAQRANEHRFWTELDAGRLDVTQTFGISKESVSSDRPFWAGQKLDRHAGALYYLSRVIELLKLPLAEQDKAFKELQRENYGGAFSVYTESVISFEKANHTKLDQAIIALAAERYRLNNHRWPELMSDMIPKYLPNAPLDPVDGKPILYRRLREGILIYAKKSQRGNESEILIPENRRNSE
ncbi:MAG TPA: hypothetical protein VGZ25_07145 [Gemmataceae bacterium]|nr:hypothetical protein [Gemmataceae bacterium]